VAENIKQSRRQRFNSSHGGWWINKFLMIFCFFRNKRLVFLENVLYYICGKERRLFIGQTFE
jgi:hypothetical protein